MSDMEVWTPVVREFRIEGETVTVAPWKARQFAAVQRLSRPVFARIFDLDPKGQVVGIGSQLFDGVFDEMVGLLAEATGRPAAWWHEQDPDRLLEVLGAVLEVNADFTRRRIAPALGTLAKTVSGALRSDGERSSPASESSDTPSPSPST